MKLSAGILLYRRDAHRVEVLVGHMGGPFWAAKDNAAWSIPKGEVDADENARETAVREFEEELGRPVPSGPLVDLGTFDQSRQKVIRIWAVEGDLDPSSCVSNTFEMEWPRGSGQIRSFPEIDRVEWFDTDLAMVKLVRGQRQVIEALLTDLA